MDIKQRFLKLKELVTGVKELSKEEKSKTNNMETKIIVDLNEKINIELSKISPDHNDFVERKKFVEKMAVWYELKYPNTLVNNLYLKGDVSNIENEKTDEAYSIKSFIKLLSKQEKKYLERPKYDRYIDFDFPNEYVSYRFDLSNNGRIMGYTCSGGHHILKDINLTGMLIEDAVLLLGKTGYLIRANYGEYTINKYKNKIHQKEVMLDCVMYEVINRGGDYIGPRRALLFAKEFKRNINIPMIYGAASYDGNIRYLINEYLKLGGKTSLECYKNYFYGYIEPITVLELLKSRNYTKEEKSLYQRLVSALAINLYNNSDYKEEQIKQKRIERGLNRSKSRINQKKN